VCREWSECVSVCVNFDMSEEVTTPEVKGEVKKTEAKGPVDKGANAVDDYKWMVSFSNAINPNGKARVVCVCVYAVESTLSSEPPVRLKLNYETHNHGSNNVIYCS